jgi:hypothetical protein
MSLVVTLHVQEAIVKANVGIDPEGRLQVLIDPEDRDLINLLTHSDTAGAAPDASVLIAAGENSRQDEAVADMASGMVSWWQRPQTDGAESMDGCSVTTTDGFGNFSLTT